VEIQSLAQEYRTKSDEELLRLALDPEQLTQKRVPFCTTNSSSDKSTARRD
jgi:hypothetical protein